jgi:hypothetical protein
MEILNTIATIVSAIAAIVSAYAALRANHKLDDTIFGNARVDKNNSGINIGVNNGSAKNRKQR